MTAISNQAFGGHSCIHTNVLYFECMNTQCITFKCFYTMYTHKHLLVRPVAQFSDEFTAHLLTRETCANAIHNTHGACAHTKHLVIFARKLISFRRARNLPTHADDDDDDDEGGTVMPGDILYAYYTHQTLGIVKHLLQMHAARTPLMNLRCTFAACKTCT